jgi:hypothetical protein
MPNPWAKKADPEPSAADAVRAKYAQNNAAGDSASTAARSPARAERTSCFTTVNVCVRLLTIATAVWLLYSAMENVNLALDIRAKGDAIFHNDITYAEQGLSLLFFHAYYCFFAVLIMLAEVRIGCLKRTILKPFRFTHTYVGRGFFYTMVGLPYAALLEWQICIPGLLLVASGLTQIGMTCTYADEIDGEYQLDDDDDVYGARAQETARNQRRRAARSKAVRKPPAEAKRDADLEAPAAAPSAGASAPQDNPFAQEDNPFAKAKKPADPPRASEVSRGRAIDEAPAEPPAAVDENDPNYNPWAKR